MFRAGTTDHDVDMAVLTGVFSKTSLTNVQNFNVTNTLLRPYQVNYCCAPQVVDLTTANGPFVLGSCAVMIPFSGPGFNPAGGNHHALEILEKLGTADSAKPDSNTDSGKPDPRQLHLF